MARISGNSMKDRMLDIAVSKTDKATFNRAKSKLALPESEHY
jgi:hypothetical protein